MASSNKKVTLDVAVKAEQENIDALEKKLDSAKKKASELKQQKLQMKFEADTQALDAANQKLQEAENKLAGLKAIPAHLNIDVSDEEIKAAEREVEQLKQEQVNLQLEVESYKLDELQSKKDAIEADEINVQLNNQSAMQGLEQIADGFSRVKSAASEVGREFGDLLSSAGKQETNFAFLKNAVGDAELARQKMSEINDIVAQLPGDDTALQGLLSSAAAKDSSLTADNLRSMANSATDYFSAMSYYGKSATEAQQDMTNYLLAGNTAELERSPILQGHIDKLKQATTVQERSKALAEALNQEHWGGMGAMDTYNNKLETFNGMIERGRYTLGGMFQEGAKGAMDFLLKLDESTNGLVGMTIAAGSFLSPVTDAVMGLGQMAVGINAIKETKLAEWAGSATEKIRGIGDSIRNIDFASKFNSLKDGLINVGSRARDAAISIGSTLKNALVAAGTAAKNAVVWLASTSKELLISAGNAMKSAAAWLWDNAVKATSTAVTKLAAAAQWLLNIAMSANPIVLVTLAIVALIAVLGYLYFNNEQVRAAVDGLGQALWGLGETIYNSLVGAFEWLNGAWQNTVDFFTQGGQSLWDTITGVFNGIYETIVGTFVGALEWLQGAWQNTVDFFTGGGQAIQDTLGGAFQWLTDTWNALVNLFTTYAPLIAEVLFVMATGGLGAIVLLINSMMGGNSQLGAIFNSMIQKALSFGSNLVNSLGNAARNAVSNFANGISRLGNALRAELEGMLSDAANFVGRIGQIMWNAAVNAWNNFLSGLQRHSPGKMMREFRNEIEGIIGIGEDAEKPLGRAMSALGKAATQGFNPDLKYEYDAKVNPLVESNANVQEGNVESLLNRIIELLVNLTIVNNINYNHYGDIDSTEKMEEILEYIRKYLYFNNDTAGRTV